MKKITTILLILSMMLLTGCSKQDNDAEKFKEEYESLNNTIRESDGAKYKSIDIPSDNPIKYVNSKETLEVLKKDQAIIYVGAGWCPWCRNAVLVLFEVAKKYNIDTIYYLNLDDEKSTYEVKNHQLEKVKEGTKDYYNLLDALKDHLNDYVLVDADNNKYDTKEKRIYMPYVIAIKDGQIIEEHVGTVSLNENQTKYDYMTDKQHDELFSIYDDMFKKVYTES